MANATSLNIGQINGAGDREALFRKVFSGEVLTAFDTACVTKERFLVRDIVNGKSASFPATWKVNADYHVPGEEIVGQNSVTNERVLTIDGLLLSDVFIPNIDEAMNHYDYRGIYSHQCGEALANAWDRNMLQVSVLAARAAATVTGGVGGTVLENAAMRTDSAVIRGGLYDAMQALSEKDVPLSEIAGYFRPAQYFLMAADTTNIDKDFGGSGSLAEGNVVKIAGVPIVMTNNMPITDVTGGRYDVNASTTAGVVTHKSAAGTVRLLGLALESEYDIRRQGTLVVAKYAVGHGILRPEAAVELRTGTPV